MVITITHREDRARAGYAVTVRFFDPHICDERPVPPPIQEACATFVELQRFLETLLVGPRVPRRSRKRASTAPY